MEKNKGDEGMSREALLIREMRRHHVDGYI